MKTFPAHTLIPSSMMLRHFWSKNLALQPKMSRFPLHLLEKTWEQRHDMQVPNLAPLLTSFKREGQHSTKHLYSSESLTTSCPPPTWLLRRNSSLLRFLCFIRIPQRMHYSNYQFLSFPTSDRSLSYRKKNSNSVFLTTLQFTNLPGTTIWSCTTRWI